MFENFKIITVGLLVVFGFYFMFEMPIDFGKINEVKADTATTSLEVGNATPSVSNVQLNNLQDISLVEDSASTVAATCTVSDSNNYHDIITVYGRVYRSGIANSSNCTTNANNCSPTTTCATSSCSGNDCVATCNFSVWFIADPTDIGSTYATQHWVAWIKAVDNQASSTAATNTTQTTEVKSLTALNINDSIDYGALGPGETIDPLSKLITATTTGNVAIDANINGTNMCTDYPTCVVATTAIAYQHYATTSGLNYASTSNGVVVASTVAQLLEFTTIKPTATPSDQGQAVYWGTYVPAGTIFGNYTGVNTFAVQSD